MIRERVLTIHAHSWLITRSLGVCRVFIFEGHCTVAKPRGPGAYGTKPVCVFITSGPITKMFAWGRGIVEDMCYER
jgi:hypothetical protein